VHWNLLNGSCDSSYWKISLC